MTTILLAVIYFAIILFLGYLAGKRARNMKDFMLGGQNLGVWVISLGIMAAVMSGWTWLGVPGTCYAYGYTGYVRLLACGEIGVVLSFIILAKPVRIISERANCMTLPDILTARWNGNRTIRLLSSLIVLVGSITYLVSQWTAMGTALQSVLGVSYHTGVMIGTIIITLYVMLGGMLASMWSNFIQMIVMFTVALILIYKCVSATGGFTAMNLAVAAINPEFVQPWWQTGSYTLSYVLTYAILVTTIAYGGQPSVTTKFMMIKGKSQLKWAPLISIIALIVGTGIFLVGIAGIVLVDNGTIPAPERADMILMSVVENVFDPVWSGIALVAIMAAIMSTASSYLFSTATTVTRDLLSQYFRVSLPVKKQLLYSRIAMVVVTVLTMIFAFNPPEMITTVGAQAFGTFCAGFAPALYLGLRWRRINSKGTIAGMLVGLILGGIVPIVDTVVFDGTMIPEITIGGVAVVLAYVVTMVVSIMTKPEPSPIFDGNYVDTEKDPAVSSD